MTALRSQKVTFNVLCTMSANVMGVASSCVVLSWNLGSSPLRRKCIVTFEINKGNWDSFIHAGLSRHISKTVKQRSHISMLPMEEARCQVENCLFSSSNCRLFCGQQQTSIPMKKQYISALNRACQGLLLWSFVKEPHMQTSQVINSVMPAELCGPMHTYFSLVSFNGRQWWCSVAASWCLIATG